MKDSNERKHNGFAMFMFGVFYALIFISIWYICSTLMVRGGL